MEDLVLKEIEGFPGYKAGSDGHVYSYHRVGKGSRSGFSKIPKKLKSGTDSLGKYLLVVLRKDGKSYTKTVHRLICEAFKGTPIGEQDSSHLDGDNKNNVPENLIWESRSSNCHRKKVHGTHDIGFKNKRALFNLTEIVQIKKWLSEGITAREISKRMKCNDRAIGKIKRGERYMGQGEAK